MAYLALYRAFRPETLDEVVRQEHIVKILRNQIAQDRVGHAYLFCGPRGTGKTSIAKIFARSINCQTPVNGSPCGKCAACKVIAGGSLDVVEIDAASNNGVDEMRDLREKVQYPPVNGKYKVYIIDEVHMLSSGAFNALLKTLEEPPKHAVFILATTESQKIPATILSRCMRFDFKLIPQEDLETHLKKILDRIEKDYDDEAVAAIARAGAGSVRDMLSIADICVSYESGKLTYEAVNAVLGSADFALTSKLCGAMLQGDMPTALSLTEKVLLEGKGIGVLVRDILQFLNNCSIAKTCRNAERILSLPKQMYDEVKGIADGADGHAILRALEIFGEAESNLRYSTSARIILETAVVKASMPSTDYNIDALIARISALEKAVSNGVKLANVPVETEEVDVAKKSKNEAPMPEKKSVFERDGFDELPPVIEEEPIFDEDAYATQTPKKTVPTPAVAPAVAPTVTPVSQPVTAMPTQTATVTLDKSKAFGLFLRSLRKTSKSGVLFTMCSELDCVFEGDTMVLTADNETIYNSLKREEHYRLIAEALRLVGVTDFDIRMQGKKADTFQENLSKLKADFADTTIKVNK